MTLRGPHVLVALLALTIVPALAGQGFGTTAAATGQELFLSEPLNPYAKGTVFVYRASGSGWTETAQLQAADGALLDRFGRTLSVSGRRLLVGATSIDSSRGAAYVFERDEAGAWKQTAKLVAAGSTAGDSFGRLVLLQGNRAFVASWGRNGGQGAVTIWSNTSGQWTEEATLGASDPVANDFFGSAMAVDGDRLLVGAAQKDTSTGVAYLFERNAAGAWNQVSRLRGRGLATRSGFGSAVSLKGDAAYIGAPGADRNAGAVFVFSRNQPTGSWMETSRLSSFDGAPGGGFGSVLEWAGNDLWIGAPGADGRQGRIYVLNADASGAWTGTSKLAIEGLSRGDQFGGAFAIAGDLATIGLPGADQGMGLAAAIIRGADGRWTTRARLMPASKGLAPMVGGKQDCANGKVQIFDCESVDMMSFLPVSSIGGGRGIEVNDIWGWTDPTTGREYALVGRTDGTAFVDVTDALRPRYLGQLPKTAASPVSVWRDIKVYKDHAYIVADGALAHGMQVFDLTRLRDAKGAPQIFTEDVHYDKIASAHNIVIDTATGYAFAVGANGGGDTCGGGLHMIDIREPGKPTFAGCFADPATGRASTGYTHDAQCVLYHGPDQDYQGRAICLQAAETAVGISDVTDKQNPKAISRVAYPNTSYTHQGWLTEDQRYFLVDDEGDEIAGLVPGTRTLIFDLTDLDDPVLASEYISSNRASDHNLYIKGNLMFQSNYVSGLRVFDVSDPKNPRPIGFFDTVPVGEDAPGFDGSWSNYPFFKSGTLVVTSGREGLFMLRNSDRNLVP